MKMHRVKEFEPRAWPTIADGTKIYIQCGFVRFTATADEAIEFARVLVAAVEEGRDAEL